MARAMKVAGVAVLLAAAALPAGAATISGGIQGFSISASTGGGGTPSQGMLFSQFNPVLGTLSGVTVSLINPNGGVLVTAALLDGLVASVTATASSVMSISQAATTFFAGGYTATASCEVTELVLMSCSTPQGSVVPIPGSFTPDTLPLMSANWGPFIGPGTLELTAAIPELGFQTSLVAPFGGIDISHAMAQWSGLVRVDYSYTEAATPEPASLALLGAGLLGLAWRRRR